MRKPHGKIDTRVYKAWISMRKRCNNPKYDSYSNYGGRGIKVCERWNDFLIFYADMGDPPPGTSLDRIDNNGDYEPGNCKWSTRKEQDNNRRGNILITHEGKTQNVTQWAEEHGLSGGVLRNRLKNGWPMEKALTTPKGEVTPKRKREREAYGQSHWKLCRFCKKYDDPSNMYISSHGYAHHRECFNAYQKTRDEKRRVAKNENPENLLDL